MDYLWFIIFSIMIFSISIIIFFRFIFFSVSQSLAREKNYSPHPLYGISPISNKDPGALDIFSLVPYQNNRYIQLRYVELFAASNQFWVHANQNEIQLWIL